MRGWLRALGRNAGRVRERFTSLAASLVTDPLLPAPAGSPAADAVAAVAAAAAAAVLLPGVSGVARWELASAVTCGLLLAVIFGFKWQGILPAIWQDYWPVAGSERVCTDVPVLCAQRAGK